MTRHKPTHCPNCNYKVDSASPVRGKSTPGEGDFTLCIDCGEWAVFNADMTMRKPTENELFEIGLSQQCQIARRAWLEVVQPLRKEASNAMNAPLVHPQHCRLGGSVAGIYTKCTKAPSLWIGRARKPTQFTREGTLAHTIVDQMVAGLTVKSGDTCVIEGESITVDDEMLTCAKEFRDWCQGVPADYTFTEEPISLDRLWDGSPPEPIYGTTDFASVHVKSQTLTVLDLKYGKGVPVPVKNNAQTLFYGLGIYYRIQDIDPTLAAQIIHVRLGIFAPRQGDTEPRFWDIDLMDLLDWGERVLKPAIDSICSDQGTTYQTGAHCRFCVGAPVCPALYKDSVNAAQATFPPLTGPLDPSISHLTPPIDLSEVELAEALNRAELIDAWVKAVRMEVSSRLNRGKEVPGWKHVAKKGYRQWLDEQQAIIDLKQAGLRKDEIFTKPEINSPAQIEKALKSRKLDPKIVKPLVHAPTTGVTLVPDNHPSPAVRTDAAGSFTPVPDDE